MCSRYGESRVNLKARQGFANDHWPAEHHGRLAGLARQTAKSGVKRVRSVKIDDCLFVTTQGLAGFIETDDGKQIFSVYVSGAVFDEILGGLFEVGADVADVAAAIQRGVPFDSGS